MVAAQSLLSLGIIPTALLSDRFGVIAGCDGLSCVDVVSEEIPGVTTSVDDLRLGFEDGDGQSVGAQVGPDI